MKKFLLTFVGGMVVGVTATILLTDNPTAVAMIKDSLHQKNRHQQVNQKTGVKTAVVKKLSSPDSAEMSWGDREIVSSAVIDGPAEEVALDPNEDAVMEFTELAMNKSDAEFEKIMETGNLNISGQMMGDLYKLMELKRDGNTAEYDKLLEIVMIQYPGDIENLKIAMHTIAW